MALEPIRWDILANIGKTAVEGYDTGQDRAIADANRARYGALGPGASLQDIGRAALQGGDTKSALAAMGLAQTGAQNEASNRLNLLQIMARRAEADRAAAQAEATSGVRAAPGGTAQIIPGSLKDPAVIARQEEAKAAGSRDTPPEDKKLMVQSEEMIKSRQRALKLMDEAASLSDQAFSGGYASERGEIAANTPEALQNIPPFPDRRRGLATLRLDNILQKEALGHLKETFGAAPSNKEGAIQLQLQGARNRPKEIRDKIIDDAREAIQDTIDIHTNRLKQLRAGTYFDPEGRPGTKAAAPVVAPVGGIVIPGAADKFTEGQIVTQKSTGKKFQMKGGQLVPYGTGE